MREFACAFGKQLLGCSVGTSLQLSRGFAHSGRGFAYAFGGKLLGCSVGTSLQLGQGFAHSGQVRPLCMIFALQGRHVP